ncbi:MAG: hypothetical protein ACYTGC_14735 [Planctomycetota bacterium]|jgi:hypothetical protein
MSINADRVNQVRAYVRWGLRAIAVMLLLFGSYLVLKRIGFGLGSRNFATVTSIWTDDLGEGSSLYRGMAMVIVGSVLAAASGWISRWIVTVPFDGCPRCGQDRAPIGETERCPECGLRWGRDA